MKGAGQCEGGWGNARDMGKDKSVSRVRFRFWPWRPLVSVPGIALASQAGRGGVGTSVIVVSKEEVAVAPRSISMAATPAAEGGLWPSQFRRRDR